MKYSRYRGHKLHGRSGNNVAKTTFLKPLVRLLCMAFVYNEAWMIMDIKFINE